MESTINLDFIRRFALGLARIDPKLWALFMGWLPFCGIVIDALINVGIASETFTAFAALLVSGPFYVCSISVLADDANLACGYSRARILFGTLIVFGLFAANKVRKQLIITIICTSVVIGLIMMIKVAQERAPRLLESMRQRR